METNYISRLPSEILVMIFKTYLSRRDRKNVRLVCRSWYERGHHDEKLLLDCEKTPNSSYGTLEHQYLENCGFKSLNLRFWFIDMRQMPALIWGKIGPRIHSLRFFNCLLGNHVVESVILNCENLRILRICLPSYDLEESFCSLETLAKLNVVRKSLDKLQIYYTSFCSFEKTENPPDFDKWKQIFRALHRIFPNVIKYGSGTLHAMTWGNDEIRFEMNFSKESSTAADVSGLIAAQAYSMSIDNFEEWRNALSALSTQRLSSVSLFLKKIYEYKDKIALLNFFSDHKELVSIEIEFEGLEFDDFEDDGVPAIPPEALTSILFHILDNCSQLRELYYCEQLNWLSFLQRSQYLQLVTKTSKLTKFSINDLLIEGSSMRSPVSCSRFDCIRIMTLSPYYSHLQHLTLVFEIPNAVLQSIFKYMINLKSLEVHVNKNLKRKLKLGTERERSSIKNLQNLERLKIHVSDKRKLVTGAFYREFELPKLRYLYYVLPEETSVLDYIGTKMPSLREIDFSQTTCIPFGETNLHFFTDGDQSLKCDIFRTIDPTRIFKHCETLKSISYYRGTYFYEPFKKEVIFVKKSFPE